MLLSAAVHSCVIGFVMLMVFHDMSILHTGDFYTFGTMAGPPSFSFRCRKGLEKVLKRSWKGLHGAYDLHELPRSLRHQELELAHPGWPSVLLPDLRASRCLEMAVLRAPRLFLLLYCDVPWMTEHFQPWMRGAGASSIAQFEDFEVPGRMLRSPYMWTQPQSA